MIGPVPKLKIISQCRGCQRGRRLRHSSGPGGPVAAPGAERDRVVAAGWPLEEDLRHRPWGLTDFRVLDPAGYYLSITDRAEQ